MKVGTDYDSPKLNGEISESSNKIRLFSSYSGAGKAVLSYSQAARWLIYLNAYDDVSSKPTKEGKAQAGGSLPSPGVGWLGKLGLIYLVGNNLFETLMLNLVMINYNCVQYSQNPIWEKEIIPDSERTEIAMPDNLAELYTIQSRRILLNRNANAVVSYKLLGGDFFEKENAFFEPMTVWRVPKKDSDPITPKRHDPSKQMWREFSVLYNDDKSEDKNKRSGIVDWFCNFLYGKGHIPSDYILKTTIASVEYGDKDFFVKNVFSDSLTMHSDILSELGRNWRSSIENEIKRCDEVADAIENLSRDLYVAAGRSNSSEDKHFTEIIKTAKEQLYYRLDMPFREWLRSIEPKCSQREKDNKIKQWQDTPKKIAFRYADELVEIQPDTAIIGHKTGDIIYSAPKSINVFRSKVNKIYERT